jgi:hypothetical protein
MAMQIVTKAELRIRIGRGDIELIDPPGESRLDESVRVCLLEDSGGIGAKRDD